MSSALEKSSILPIANFSEHTLPIIGLRNKE